MTSNSIQILKSCLFIMIVIICLLSIEDNGQNVFGQDIGNHVFLPLINSNSNIQSSQTHDQDLLNALNAAIAIQQSNPSSNIYYKIVDTYAKNNWAVAYVEIVSKLDDVALNNGGRAILARKNHTVWQIYFPGDENYQSILSLLPILDPLEKSTLEVLTNSNTQLLPTVNKVGYRLPWTGGTNAVVTQNYSNHSTGQIDFGILNDTVVAAKTGTIVYINDTHSIRGCNSNYSRYNNVVVIKHSNDEITLYLHLAKDSVPPSIRSQYLSNGFVNVSRGTVIGREGNVGYTCGATGNHLHLSTASTYYTYSRADIYDEDGDGNTTEQVWSAWTDTHHRVDFDEYSYDQLASWPQNSSQLTSQNYIDSGSSCPAPNLISPTDGQILSSRTVNFSWQALSGCSFSGYTFRLKDTNNMDSGGTTIVDTGVSGTSHPVTIDAQWDNRDLYWGVRAANASSASWAVWRFRIQPSGGSTCGDPGSNEVVIFANTNYDTNGNCKKLGIGDYPNPGHFSPVGNDDIASVKVGSNVQLELCAHDNYGTPCSTFTVNDADLGNDSIGANNASSAKVSTRGTSSGSWTARYYDDHTCWGNTNCSQSPRCTETIGGPNLDKNWGTNAPCGGMDGDTWIGDFQATINFPAGDYVFQLEHDDGAKLWVEGENNNNPIQDRGTVESGPVCPPRFLSGNRNVRVQLREDGGDARIKLIRTTDKSLCLPDTPPAPVLNAPSNDSKFEHKDNILLRWNSSSGATRYWAEYDRDSGGALQSKDTSSLFWDLGSGQLGIGRYRWRVNASNAGGVSPWSGNWYFTVVPNRPLALTAAPLSDSQIALSWTRPSGPFDNFRIYRQGISSPLATVGASSTAYTVSGLTCGTQYTFLVTAYASGNYESPNSNGVIATTNACPPQVPVAPTLSAPANGSTFAHQNSVTLRWNSSQNATQYQVEYTHNTGTVLVPAQSSLELTFNSGQLAVSDYSWRVRAGNAGGWSAWSASRNFTVRPNQPTNLAAQPVTASQIALAWTNPGGDLNGFKIYVNGQSTPHATVGSSASAYTYSGATCGTNYSFQVKAYKFNGTEYQSTPSNTATASTTCPATPKVNVKVAFQGRGSSQPHNVPIKLQIKNASGTQTVWETTNWVSVTPDGSGSRGTAVVDVASAGLTAGQTYRFYVRGAMHLDKLVTAQYSDGMTLDLTNSAINPDGILWACDIDQDNVVNILDEQLFNNNFGQSYSGPPDPNSVIYRSDGNGDGTVNMLDYSICSNSFGKVGDSAPPANQPPTASFTANPTSGQAPLTVSFNASASSDSDGTIVSYAWDFGNGQTATGQTTNHVYTTAGTYQARLTVTDNGGSTGSTTRTITVNAPQSDGNVIYLSSSSNGKIGGFSFADEDILTFNRATNTWQMLFDGSDVGLGNNDINAFAVLPDGSLLLSVELPKKIGTLGSVDDSDILRFVPTSLGWNTVGSFEWYLDGSDVELAAGGEDVDSIAFAPDGRLLISTLGTYKVTNGLAGGDEDVLVFSGSSFGENSSGTWSLYFDGSDVDLKNVNEDIADLWVNAQTGAIYLTTWGAFAVPGLAGDGSDIFICQPTSLGNTTGCTFSMYWDGSAYNFQKEVVDALAVAPAILAQSAALPSDATASEDAGEEADDSEQENARADLNIGIELYIPLINR